MPRPQTLAELTGQRAHRHLVGARPREPHRRAHRLQRRVRAAVRDPAPHARGPRHARRTAASASRRRSMRMPSRSASPSSTRCSRRTATRCPSGPRYPLGVAWALLRATGVDPASVTGVDLAFASDVPVGAGLSSSAAIEGAVASALNDTWGLGLDRVALAQVGRTRRERGRRRADRDHGPDGVDARPRRRRDLPRLPLARGDGRRPRLRRRRPRAARDRHRRQALARDRRLRRAPRRRASAAPRIMGVPALRDVSRRRPARAPPSSWTT